ncbi:YgaP family membrane protein [Arundinibacter roseus]|uniref:DUF2892 domain-containing protein n=1 Tax=Arundinibacter roseus TaxID=2070510 RepID=A0A4R4KC13_9BACT|nr:DUF2892 domain-containing protein [Arundinibacter roseus]TDB64206.1 DUF2892 domain-containing protein [Arundinibacter roseus]
MKTNMGGTDRMIRVILAIAAVTLYFSNLVSPTLSIIALVVAGVFLLTSFLSFCPLYTLFGVSTCKTRS